MGIHFLTGFNQKKKKFKWDSLKLIVNKKEENQSHEVFFVCWYQQSGFSLSIDAVIITIYVFSYNMLCNDGS